MLDPIQTLLQYILDLGGEQAKAMMLVAAVLAEQGKDKAAEKRRNWDREYRRKKKLIPPDSTRFHPKQVDDGIYVKPMGDGLTGGEVKELPVKQVTVKAGAREADFTEDFNLWYAEFPRKVARSDGLKAYLKLRKKGVLAEPLIEGLRRFKANLPPDTAPTYIPYPASWLNKRRWEDEEDHALHVNHPSNSNSSAGRSQARETTLATSLGRGALRQLEKSISTGPKNGHLSGGHDPTGDVDFGFGS